MAFGCPVCNGLKHMDVECSRCGALMDDTGRLTDLYADYSPYREIDDLRMTNGFPDLANEQCLHVFYCSLCGQEETVGIAEQRFM